MTARPAAVSAPFASDAQRCEPFRWTKTSDKILTKAHRREDSDTRHLGASVWQADESGEQPDARRGE